MSDSVKHRTFMGFDLQVHNITIIPGIGPAYAAILATHGYIQASQVFLLFLGCLGDQGQFVARLKELTGGGLDIHMLQAYNALLEWYKQHGIMPPQ